MGNDPVSRMARHREAMALALAENLSLKEATDRLARERWLEANAKLQARRQCGTATPAQIAPAYRGRQGHVIVDEFAFDDAAERPEPWWQRL